MPCQPFPYETHQLKETQGSNQLLTEQEAGLWATSSLLSTLRHG